MVKYIIIKFPEYCGISKSLKNKTFPLSLSFTVYQKVFDLLENIAVITALKKHGIESMYVNIN